MDRRREAVSDEGLVSTVTPTMRVPDDDDQVVEDGLYTAKNRADLEKGQVRPKSGRSPHLSGGIGQPRSADKASPATENALAATSAGLLATSTDASATSSSSSAATSSESALAHSISPLPDMLLFSPWNNSDNLVVLLDAPSPAPHIARSSPPPPSDPISLDAPNLGATSPRTPPNLRLEIPPQGPPLEGALPSARDTLRAPFAPDPENEGICTEVGSLGQEIQLESGDHLNALERIYLYTQSKATFHRIFMSRALPTYLKEVTPTEAVEYVLPLLGGLAIDEEERVKEAFVGELLSVIWWFFTTCRVTDQEPEPPAEPELDTGLDNPTAQGDSTDPVSTEPPLVSVQSFSAVLASLLLSSNPEVSATARGTVVELLGRTRWIVKQGEASDESIDQVQDTQYCETMRPVEPWSRGLLGPDEARMIELEIIYGVIIDLGSLDLNGELEEAAPEGEAGHELSAQGQEMNGEGIYDLEGNKSREDLSTLVGSSATASSEPNSTLALPSPVPSTLTDPALTPTLETVKSYTAPMADSSALDEDKDANEDRQSGFGSLTGPASASSKNPGSVSSLGRTTPASSSSSSLELSNNSAYLGFSTPRSAPAATTTFNHSSFGFGTGPIGIGASPSRFAPGVNGVDATSSNSSLNLPDLSPGDSSSRSSIASPAEPISPPEGAAADYVINTTNGEDYRTRSAGRTGSVKGKRRGNLSLPGSALSSDIEADELMWHTPRGGEGLDSGYFDPPTGTSSADGSTPTPVLNGANPIITTSVSSSTVVSGEPSPTVAAGGEGLAPPFARPLRRQESAISIGAVSEINPDDYADAESGGDWVDDWVGDAQRATETAAAEEEQTANEAAGAEDAHGEAVPETGEALVDVCGTDACIDDGAAAEEAAIGRVASMSLIAAVISSGVVDEEFYTLFVDEVMRVSADPVYWVRSETSYALGTLAKTVDEQTTELYLLPTLESLMKDSEAHVRQSSVFAIPSVLKRLSPQRRRELASKYMLALCEDAGESVRTSALQVLAEVIHTFQEDEGGPPEELLDYFLKGENEQVQAPLTKPEPKKESPIVEKDPYSQWAAPSQTTWGNEPGYFEEEPSFPDPDRALICAFNYPAIALTLGSVRWSRLAGYYRYLAQESWHTPKVRSTLAASAGEVARIVGPRAAQTDIVPVWWMCLSGDQSEAKIKALKALPLLLESLDAEGRAHVATKLDEAWENHVPGWKERDAFARQLGLVVPLLKSEGSVLCRIFRSGLEDRVAAIREAVVAALPILHDTLKDDDLHMKVARDDLFALGESSASRHKTTFLASCRALVEHSQGASIMSDPRFRSCVEHLAKNSVIDVRIGLGRLLTAVCEHHMHTSNERPPWVVDCLEKLTFDDSPDVRAFVHRVTSTEYIEPKPSTSKQKPDVRSSSPGFAEFSRPP